MKTIVKITNYTVGEIHEYRYTDRLLVNALIDALNSYSECGGFISLHKVKIEVEEQE